jgi:D-alanyl-D-alanine dipeptidase
LRAGGSKSDDQLQLTRKDYKVKLVVEEAIKDIIVKSERIEFDGTILAVDSDYRPHGVIGVQFWDVYLIANN